MKFMLCQIPDLILIQPDKFTDSRGFLEICNYSELEKAGIVAHFVQENRSISKKNVLRGLHYQVKRPQAKLVQVTKGEVFDVSVDIRRNSATFGQWHGQILSEKNGQMLWIPAGFAHGFLALSETSEFVYRCTDIYAPEFERCIIYNDSDLAISWPFEDNAQPIMSPKDLAGVAFSKAECFHDLSGI